MKTLLTISILSVLSVCHLFADDIIYNNGVIFKNCKVIDTVDARVRFKTTQGERTMLLTSISSIISSPFDSLLETTIDGSHIAPLKTTVDDSFSRFAQEQVQNIDSSETVRCIGSPNSILIQASLNWTPAFEYTRLPTGFNGYQLNAIINFDSFAFGFSTGQSFGHVRYSDSDNPNEYDENMNIYSFLFGYQVRREQIVLSLFANYSYLTTQHKVDGTVYYPQSYNWGTPAHTETYTISNDPRNISGVGVTAHLNILGNRPLILGLCSTVLFSTARTLFSIGALLTYRIDF